MYRIYKKQIYSRPSGKMKTKWFYWYRDPITNKQITKTCRNCNTKREAEMYIASLPPVSLLLTATIKEVAEFMYVPGSPHMERREQFGKTTSVKTILDGRNYVNLIIEKWGHLKITEIKTFQIQNYLLSLEKSGSWKNRYQGIFSEIFEEAGWYGIQVAKPSFTRFKRNTVKQTVLSTEEIKSFFVRENFSSEMFYVLFLTCLSGGLRLGEVRALQVRQFLYDKQILIIDGFLNQDGSKRNDFNKKGTEDDPKHRVVLIPENVTNILLYYISENNLQMNDYIFTYTDKPLRQEYCQKEFKRALKKAGIETENRKLSIHALRYTYVTRTRRLLDSSTTMLMTGHTDLKMTDYYTRFELEETIKQLEPVKGKIEHFFS